MFRRWLGFLPPDVEVLGLVLPGRDEKMQETPLADPEVVVSRVASELAELPGMVTTLFGHSLGALIALSGLQKWSDRTHPASLIVSACNAPHVKKLQPDEPTWQLSDEEFVHRVRELNGTPPEILDSPELLALFLPMLRSDFKLAELLRDCAGHGPFVPMSVLYGSRDEEVTQEGVLGWARYASGTPVFHRIDGDHFFVKSHTKEICKLVEAHMRPR